jgi:hypothetical protein
MPAHQVEIAEAAHTVLDSRRVRHLDPQEGLFAAMLEGGDRLQASRLLASGTRLQRTDVVRRFMAFTGTWPWSASDVEDWTAAAVGAEAAGAFDDPRLPQRARAVPGLRNRPALRLGRAVRTARRYAPGAGL